MKIVKHCHESLPHMVSGSLLGLEVSGGILEVTHAFPFPDSRAAAGSAAAVSDTMEGDQDGHEYQIEMMRMLREVNVDNNCVGWYQSMYLGIYSTSSLLENQLSYQTDLSPNAVVILYDPMQTTHGKLALKCYRLTEECIRLKENEENAFIDPRKIFEEVPVKLTNPRLVKALLMDVADGVHDDSSNLQLFEKEHNTNRLGSSTVKTTFDRLDLSTNPYLEKHLEFLCGWVDDLAVEQQKMQFYARQLHRDKHRRKDTSAGNTDAWASSDAPRRMESLLITNQIRSYCEQMNQFTSEGIEKVYLMSGMQKKD
jgi:translation initiation factor 3 subunit H